MFLMAHVMLRIYYTLSWVFLSSHLTYTRTNLDDLAVLIDIRYTNRGAHSVEHTHWSATTGAHSLEHSLKHTHSSTLTGTHSLEHTYWSTLTGAHSLEHMHSLDHTQLRPFI